MCFGSKLRTCAGRHRICCQIFCIFNFFFGSSLIIGGSYLTDKYTNNYNCFNENGFYCEVLEADQIYFGIGVALLVFGIVLLIVSTSVFCYFYGIPEISKQISKTLTANTTQTQLQLNLIPSASLTNTAGLSIPSLPQVDSQLHLSQQSIMYTAQIPPYPSEYILLRPSSAVPPGADQSKSFSSTLSVPGNLNA